MQIREAFHIFKYKVHYQICLLTYKALHEEQPVYLHYLIATSLPSHSLRSNRGITLSVPRIKTTLVQGCSALAPLLFGTTFHYLSVQPPSEDVSKHTFRLGLLPVDTDVPNGLLMLRNSFNNFVFEHRSGCCTTEPGYTRDIGAIEIWLIEIEIDIVNIKFVLFVLLYSFNCEDSARGLCKCKW